MNRPEEVYFVNPNLNSESMGDAAEHGFPTATEAPHTIFMNPWKTFSRHREAAVAHMFTYRGEDMILTRDERRRAFGVTNPTTHEVMWIPFDQLPFGGDQVNTVVELTSYLESGISQLDTPLARVLQKPNARAMEFSVDEKVGVRGGNPNHKSIFKPRFGARGKMIR